MPTYKSPGVYIEEISVFPPSIAAVETAIPAFIGYTEKAEDANGDSLEYVPTRITSLLEYQQYFGGAEIKALSVDVVQSATGITVSFSTDPGLPDQFLYYSMQLFFANGGGPCYIVSIGDYTDAAAAAQSHFLGAAGPPIVPNVFTLLESEDEPTLLIFPDATLLSDAGYAAVANAALAHCNKMQDRFTIADVRNAIPGQTDTNAEVTNNFRNLVTGEPKYGAAYFPYVATSLPWRTDDTQITVASHTGAPTAAETVAAGSTLDTIKTTHTAVYNAVKQFIDTASVTLPPSGGVAGVYARVDASRGVWKAPANVSLVNVIEPAVKITNDLNDGLNIDATSGKSVNAIRSFSGKGTLVWGARTLAGNDNENRYIPVRRWLIFAEESIKKAIAAFVFEPNDAATWVKVRSMIESFLTRQWRDGALAGAKPEHAFYVLVGLNKTMTADDILNGYMIVEIGVAIVRPAEFIVLRFAQKMQES
ncbi:MAG: phage tail sheath family protein [Chloroflexi bacterium]|nr:MAG: phage tail sheath family protein [Chloroflexota bacterium]